MHKKLFPFWGSHNNFSQDDLNPLQVWVDKENSIELPFDFVHYLYILLRWLYNILLWSSCYSCHVFTSSHVVTVTCDMTDVTLCDYITVMWCFFTLHLGNDLTK